MLQSSLLLKSQTNAENHPFDIKILLLYILALSTAARSTTSLSMFRTALRRTPVASMISENIQQVATRLVHSSQQTQQKQFVCIAVAGGGSHAISTLASTPGASSLFLEGTVVYDRNSIQSYVGQVLPDDFNYVSPDTAQGLSRAAVRHALQYRASLEDYPHCIGVGITSALVTQKLRVGRGSFGYLCATRADGTEYTCHVKLAPQYRNRTEEDIVMGQLALQAIEQLQTGAVSPLVLEEGDELNESFQSPEGEDTVFAAAERILEGHCTAVLLLPQPETKTFMAVTDPVLPLGSLVFPGSFNPPHHGHTTLAKVASRASNQKPVFLEISLFNADKPSVDAKSVSERAHRIFDLVEELPSQWGILLTNAALFKEKVEVLKPFMAPGMYRKTWLACEYSFVSKVMGSRSSAYSPQRSSPVLLRHWHRHHGANFEPQILQQFNRGHAGSRPGNGKMWRALCSWWKTGTES
jgi:hypothetical protein